MALKDHALIFLVVSCAAVAAATWKVSEEIRVAPISRDLNKLKEQHEKSNHHASLVSDLQAKLTKKEDQIKELVAANKELNNEVKIIAAAQSSIRKTSEENSKWTYRHFKNTQTNQLVSWVNSLNAGPDDVVSAISVNDFHVWARKGDADSGSWQRAYEEWDAQSSDNIKSGLKNNDRIVLGLSGKNLHYLKWAEN